MSKKNNRRARQQRLHHLALQEKAEAQKREEKLKKKKDLRDITSLLDSVDLTSKPEGKNDASQNFSENPKPTIYNKIRSLFSNNKRHAADDMETDEPPSRRPGNSGSKSLLSGVRTLKSISKKKMMAAAKLGGTGISKGVARVSLNPNKPKAPKRDELKQGLVSPKTVPSRLKNTVRRVNKRLSKSESLITTDPKLNKP